MSDHRALFGVLRQSVRPSEAEAIEALVVDGLDRQLCRVNPLAFAAGNGLDEEETIAAFLHVARLGIFEMSWNVLCPGCGGVLDANTSLRTVRSETYTCALCAAGYEPTLDEMVEVTFTVSPRVRRIAAHDPHGLPPLEYFRQIYWGSGADLPEDDYEALANEFVLDALEVAPGEKAILSLQLPEGLAIAFEPVTHAAQFLDVRGPPTKERQKLTLVFDRAHRHHEKVNLSPGPLRISVENHTDVRTIPSVCLANDALHALLGRRRPFLTAKRLLSNQTFRDIHRTSTLDIDQRLRITSLTFLFTDLRGSTQLYKRVGDLAAFDLVRAHFTVLNEIVASQAGAVVKTIGDAVMATFPTPEQAVAAAIRMRTAMTTLGESRGREDLVLKIGIHEGPCIAVSLNERQDYFGQTVNIASRVQRMAQANEILATGSVLNDRARRLLCENSLVPLARNEAIRGVESGVTAFAIPA